MAQSNTTLEPNFHICELQGCRKISLEDTTGLYEETNNPGGWGTDASIADDVQNPYVTEVTNATLDFIFPDLSTFQVDLKALYADIFPNTDKQDVTLTNTNLGLVGAFPTGWYTVTYTVSGSQIGGEDVIWSASTTKELFFVCSVQCSLDNAFVTIDSSICEECSENKLGSIVLAQGYLDAAKAAACCNQTKKALKLLDRASFELNKNGCSKC